MKVIFKYLLFILPSFVISVSLQAQEVMIPLSGNQEAEHYYQNLPALRKATDADTVELPFIDDFSNSTIRPKPSLWMDFNAYVNNKYPVFPVTAGVATLDAIRYDGSQYPDASTSAFIADHLTSNPVDLDYPVSDSIYLSFFYQPEGKGEAPETQDSLCLEFYDTAADQWNHIWSVPGQGLQPFRQVMIPVKDPRYLTSAFRFRFYNYASQAKNNDYTDKRSNVDHWHLDYIRLDRLRSKSDTVLRDVSFVSPISSILKSYETVPWTHLQDAYFQERTAFIKVVLSNHDTITRNVTRYLEMQDLSSGYVYKPTPTASDIPAGDSAHFFYPYDYPFDFNQGDSASFLIKTYIRTDAFDYKPNDTLRYVQEFKNYYAYDDGSSEAGYGLRGNNSQNASVAVRFESFRPDSLRAVDMYFNQVMDSVNLRYYFYLKIWGDNDGVPGELIYSQLGVKPEYSSQLNKFQRYPLDSAIYIDGTFYVGWTKTVDKMLNLGMDLNRNSSSSILYNIGGEWNNTQYPASLMLRPVMSMNPLVSGLPQEKVRESLLKIYPNPAGSYFQFDISGGQITDYSLYLLDVTGRRIATANPSMVNELNVSELKNGIYFVYLVNHRTGKSWTEKLIIHH